MPGFDGGALAGFDRSLAERLLAEVQRVRLVLEAVVAREQEVAQAVLATTSGTAGERLAGALTRRWRYMGRLLDDFAEYERSVRAALDQGVAHPAPGSVPPR